MDYNDILVAWNPKLKPWHPNDIDDEFIEGSLPFIDFLNEDLSDYPDAKDSVIGGTTLTNWRDDDNDFKVGLSGGILCKNDFIFIGTEAFSDAAHTFEKTGSYSIIEKNTPQHKTFWTKFTDKRRKGMTLNCKLYKKDLLAYLEAPTRLAASAYLHPLHITGDHYNYLNYGRIMRTPTDEEVIELEKQGKEIGFISGFPRFWDGDYWNFKLDQFVARNQRNLCKAKARSKGYSFKRGSQAANRVNLNKDIRITIAAFDAKTYLFKKGGTTDMIKKNLDWYEQNTAWKRGYISEDYENIELGYKLKTGQHTKHGWGSAVNSVSLWNNPNATVGGERSVEIDYEEAGVCPNLEVSLGVTLSSTEVGGRRIGTIRVYGTGGTKEANWEPFKNVFYGPHVYHMLAMENVWDDGARNNICGFFHPQVLNLEPFMDNHGNSLVIKAYKYDVLDKHIVEKDPQTTSEKYSIYCAQRANKPAEAFGNVKENLFSSKELDTHYKNNTAVPNTDYVDGMLIEDTAGEVKFISNDELKAQGIKTHAFITDYPIKPATDLQGCFRVYIKRYAPDGKAPIDLYDSTIDPIGKDVENKELTTSHSLDAFTIFAYPNLRYPVSDRLVAMYIGRREADETVKLIAMACDYWNMKVLPEVDRGTVVPGMKRLGKLNKIHRDPSNYIKTGKNPLTAPYGINIGGGDGSKTQDAYIALKDWLYTKIGVNSDGDPRFLFHTIQDIGILKELTSFRVKGNFDRLCAMRIWPALRTVYRMKKLDERTKITVNKDTLLGTLNKARNYGRN